MNSIIAMGGFILIFAVTMVLCYREFERGTRVENPQ